MFRDNELFCFLIMNIVYVIAMGMNSFHMEHLRDMTISVTKTRYKSTKTQIEVKSGVFITPNQDISSILSCI